MTDNCGVYAIRSRLNPERVYVGSSVNLRKRENEHWRKLATGRHHSIKLQRAYDKYGRDQFWLEVLEYCEPGELLAREQAQMERLNAVHAGYNICPLAGNSLGCKRTDETKTKISRALVGNTHTLGHKLSESHKAALRAGSSNRVVTPEQRAQIAARNRETGQVKYLHTEESQKKAALARTGLKRSAETKAKIGANWKGRKHSPESLAKMREAGLRREAAKRERLARETETQS